MIKYAELRVRNYEDRRKQNLNFGFDISDWKSNPYSFIKARLYIELSSIFAFFFQFTFITANHISIAYCISGILAGLLLITNDNTLMIAGLVIFFLKGSLDWTDGLIARIRNQTSSVGHILDTWGSHIGTISLITSLGIYCFNISEDNIFLFLTIFILFLNIVDFKLFAYHQLFYELINDKIQLNLDKKEKEKQIEKKNNLFVIFLKNFMDGRARTVDTICFLILLEVIFEINYFSKIIFLLYLIKTIIFCFGVFYVYYYKERLEKEIR